MNEDGDECDKDNRNIVDDTGSQKLTREDIEEIRKNSGGIGVIKSLVDNHSTFEAKNKYSQEKYLLKKKQKYLKLFSLLKPSTRVLIEMYFAKGPSKNK